MKIQLRQSGVAIIPCLRGRVLLAAFAGLLVFALLVPGPHKPASFSLTDPVSWFSASEPIPADHNDRPVSDSTDSPAAESRLQTTWAARTRSTERASSPPTPKEITPDASEAEHQTDSADPISNGDDDEAEQPDPSLSITGSVLDDAGTPLPGIRVRAEPGNIGEAITNDLGMFAFEDVERGEYLLSVADSDAYHGARTTVRAGAQSAELHLQRKGEIIVIGQVTDAEGQVIENVLVRQLGSQQRRPTDADGIYEIEVELNQPGSQSVLEFTHHQHRDTRERVSIDPAEPFAPVMLDVVMQAEREKVIVFGRIENPLHEPVVGAEVSLSAAEPRAHHRTTSDQAGEYHFNEVEIGDRYRISVVPPDQAYKRHASELINVGPEDTAYDVTLEPSSPAELSGTVVDPSGHPIPAFTVWLRNTEAPNYPALELGTDGQGRFPPVEVPAGTIRLETRSAPLLNATGIELSPGETRDVEIPLDWGRDWLLGQVLDTRGEPVNRATVVLQWNRQYPHLRSASRRETRTDGGGYFNFANLAAPDYQITVRAPGFETKRMQVPFRPGKEITIELEGGPELASGGGP